MVRSEIRRNIRTNRHSFTQRLRTRLLVQGLEDRTAPAMLVVTDPADSGANTLRGQMAVADVNGEDDTITFSGVTAINLSSAEMTLTSGNSLLIDGAGVTITGNPAVSTTSRIFNFSGAPTATPITLKGLTLTNSTATGNGGAILVGDEALTLDGVTVANSKASSGGGGIYITSGTATLTVRNSTITANVSTAGGGITVAAASTKLLVESCTFTNNFTSSGNSGGAIRYVGTPGIGNVFIRNSTFFGNTGGFHGGAIGLSSLTGEVLVENCTIVGNYAGGSATTSTGNGGAIGTNAGSGTITINSSIIYGNTVLGVGTNPEIFTSGGTGTVIANNSLIGNPTGAGIFVPDATTSALLGLDPLVNPLASNGGPTETMKLQGGSPTINKGSNPAGLLYDQRGPGFPRVLGGTADIGAFELNSTDPYAAATSPNVPPINATQKVTVVYNDETGINTGGIGTGNIRLTGPGYGSPEAPTGFTITSGSNGDKTITVEYTFTPPGGSWDWPDDGKYSVQMQGGQVFDVDGPTAVSAGTIGFLTVAIPLPPLVVDNEGDDIDGDYTAGKFTLREAIGLANTATGTQDSISFAPAMSGKTITFGSEIKISDSLVITGPGKSQLTLSGGSSTRLFNINVAGVGGDINISGVTISGGNVIGTGGAILAADETLTFSQMTVTGNTSSGAGGAVHATGPTVLNIVDSIFSANAATGSGGAINLAGAATITIDNGAFVDNTATTTGGGFHVTGVSSSTVTLSNFTNNQATTSGGGFYHSGNVLLQIDDCTFETNRGGVGGGFRTAGTSSTVTINRSLLTGNTATSTIGGGAYIGNGGQVTINDTTFTGNTATTSGGGIRFSTHTVTLNNSTFSGNVANGATTATGGGGIVVTGAGNVTVNNSTITKNSVPNALAKGGGLFTVVSTAIVTLNSTILAENSASVGQDISSNGTLPRTVAGDNNLIGAVDPAVINLTGANDPLLVGSEAAPVSPGLGALGNNGGPTPTHAPLAGSLAVNNGNNNAGLTFDQRGTGFPRVVNGAADVGSFESNLFGSTVPIAKGSAPNVPPINPTQVVTVVYTDETGINTAGIGTGNIRLTGPGYGAPEAPTAFNITSGSSGDMMVTVEYTFTPPGGSWDFTDNGKYVIEMQAGQVFDTDGTPNSVLAGPKGSFTVAAPLPPLVVDNSGDADDGIYTAGQLTLREAIGLTNGVTGSQDSISFAPALNGTTITFLSEIKITDPVIITGPGADKLTLDGAGGAFRALNIDLITSGGVVSISGLTISNFSVTGDGGGINNQDADLTLTGMVLKANTASTDGGGINVELAGAKLTLVNSVLDGNVATAGNGGGINFLPSTATTTTITNSALRNNVALGTGGDGGAIFANAGPLLITGSTLSGNTANNTSAAFGGGGVYLNNVNTMTVTNSTVSGNFSAGGGGGLHLDDGGTLNLFNSTVVGNNSIANGGGINLRVTGAVANIVSSIVAGNSGATGSDVFSPSGASVNIEAANLGNSTGITTLNQTGVNFLDVDPLLNPLGDNGGFSLPDGTKINTHALQAASPVVDKGINPQALSFDQRGPGFLRSSGVGVDIGAYEIQGAATAAKVTSVKIDDGTAQHSLIRSLTVTFDQPVELPVNPADAFTLTRQGGGSVTLAGVVSGGGTVVTLTFSGAETEFTSLKDGRFNFSIDATKVTTGGGALQLDGNGDGTGGDNYVLNSASAPAAPTNVWRLFGDSDGDNDVDTSDFGAFRAVFGGTSSVFDFDNDGDVDTTDFGAFRARFGGSI